MGGVARQDSAPSWDPGRASEPPTLLQQGSNSTLALMPIGDRPSKDDVRKRSMIWVGIGILCFLGILALIWYFWPGVTPRYNVIIDAGSMGARVYYYVYKDSRNVKPTEEIKGEQYEERPLQSFGGT